MVDKTQFIIECNKRLIHPNVAIENESIKEAFRTGSTLEKVCELLDSELKGITSIIKVIRKEGISEKE